MRDPSDIYNWRRVDRRLTTSGQPSEDQLREIQRLGVTHVVNLGLHDHEDALADEAASVARLGMEYIHIPVVFDNPTQHDFEQFCAALTQIGAAPVHVHCIANYRVTAFLYKYQRDVLGMDAADARKTMDTVWRPGGVWAQFIGEADGADTPYGPVR